MLSLCHRPLCDCYATTHHSRTVLIVKFGAQRLVALRLEVPSLKRHIPLISALRMSVRSVKATPRLPRHYVPRNDIRNIPLAHAVRITLLVDRRSLRKIRHCDDGNKCVYCHISHLHFAFLIAPIIFAIISDKNITVATISQNYRLDIFPFNKRCS